MGVDAAEPEFVSEFGPPSERHNVAPGVSRGSSGPTLPCSLSRLGGRIEFLHFESSGSFSSPQIMTNEPMVSAKSV
jgi:hypothetical protein